MLWKKSPPLLPPSRVNCDHHRIIVEKDGQTSVLSPSELNGLLKISYVPHIEFLKDRDFQAIHKKTIKYHKRGWLDSKQLWLGAYFQKELQTPSVPPIRLRWIDETVGWGVFAEEDLHVMQYIGEYSGIIRRKKRIDSKNAYCFQYSIVSEESTRYTIDAQNQGGVIRFVNHSSRPNLTSALATCHNLSHVVIFSNRAIKKGEQLCYDYGPDYWNKRTPPLELYRT